MTPDQMDRINGLLAENVMRWIKTFLPFDPDNWWWEKDGEVKAWSGEWSPTINPAQTFEVVEEMRKKGWSLHFHNRVENRDLGVGFAREFSSMHNLVLYKETPATAICLAAKAALEGEEKAGKEEG